jgi:FkbM family methyltransferase
MPVLTRLYSVATKIRRKLFPRRTDSLSEASISKSILGEQDFVAVDAGAAHGLLPHWQYLPHVAKVYQIEPREQACAELEAINQIAGYSERCQIVAAGLSREGGKRVLYVTNAPTGSSLHEIDPAKSADCAMYLDLQYLNPVVPTIIETMSLSQIMNQFHEDTVDMIKLDIQGAELEVMRGLDDQRMRTLLGVEIELGLHDLYPKDTGFCAAKDFFENQGFELFDVRVARVHLPRNKNHGGFQSEIFSTYSNAPSVSARIWEFDALFFKKKSILFEQEDANILRRMMVVYCTYNYFSEAFSLAEKAEELGLFSQLEARALKQAIVDLHHVKHYHPWLGDSRIMRFLRGKVCTIVPRSAPRWCQYMYQNYPNG